MTELPWFDDAARLYAENYDVVMEMEKAYRESAARALRTLETAIELRLAPKAFRRHSSPSANRYWWVGEGSYEEHPYLWFGQSNPAYFDHQSIVLFAYAPTTASPRQIEALRSITLDSALTKEVRGGKFDLFRLELPFDSIDTVTDRARQIASVLRTLEETYESAASP